MEDKNSGGQTPKNIEVNTLVVPSDFEPVQRSRQGAGVSQQELEDAVTLINPDLESMESRG